MTNVIFKYELQPHRTTIRLPAEAKPLFVGVQNNQRCLWVERPIAKDTTEIIVPRFFVVYGTGEHHLNCAQKYIGTIMDRPFVWHVYEMLSQPDAGPATSLG